MPSWKHQKNLTIPDEVFSGVKPSDWNAELNAEGTVGHLVGVPSGAANQKLQDIPLGTGLSFQGGTLLATGVTDAPSNGILYGRFNGGWVASAPASHTHLSSQITDLDGQIQTKITAFGGGIPEAPLTGVTFGRKSGGWVTVPDTAHTHTAGQITDFPESVDDRVATLLRPGTGITLAYNDAVNTLTITATGGGGVTDGDKGDITVAGGGTTFTIDNGAVTYAKMQAVSTNILLGRATAGSGIVEEIPLTSSGRQILASTSFATMMTALGAAPISHIHTPAEITGLQEQVGDWVGTLLVAGTGITLNYNDAANMLTISSGGGGGSLPAYALTNVVTDRIMDADLVTIDELADVLGTLITDIAAGGVGGGGGSGGSTQALSETRAAAVSSTIDVAVKSLRTAGYDAVGDGGDALYKRVNAQPSHSGYFRSLDSFKADGTTDATNGGYWEIIVPPEGIAIECFGGKCDGTSGAVGTDNSAAYVAAQSCVSVFNLDYRFYKGGPKILFRQNELLGYRFASTITPDRTVHLKGRTSAGVISNGAVGARFHFPAGVKGIVLQGWSSTDPTTTNPGAAYSVIEDIAFLSDGHGGQTDKHGIQVGITSTVRNVRVTSFGGNGINIQADVLGAAGSNANMWHVDHALIAGCAGHGLYAQGGDSNGGIGYGIDVRSNGGYGIYDISFLANTYIGCHADGNAGGAYYGHGLNAPTIFLGCYSEGGQPTSIINSPAMSIGGLHGAGISGTGWHGPGAPGMLQKGSKTYGTGTGEDAVLNFIAVPPNRPDALWNIAISSGLAFEMRWWTAGYFAQNFAGADGPLSWGWTWGGTYTGGRTTPIYDNNFILPSGVWIQNRFVGALSFDPTTDTGVGANGGEWARGDRVYNTEPTAGGFAGWICVTGGVVAGPWTASYGYGFAYVKTAANRYYKIVGGGPGANTVEPTHTSGTVTGADGWTYRYIGTTAAVFKTFGAITA